MIVLNRRSLIAAMAATGAAIMLENPLDAAKGKLFFERIKRPIGLQLYTLGDEPAKDLDGTLAKVAAIGLRDLQLPSLFGKAPAELRSAGDRAGVKFSCIHLATTPGTPATMLSFNSETQRIVDDLGALGVKDAVMPLMLFPASFKMGTGGDFRAELARAIAADGPDLWKRTAAMLNEKAAALKPHGIRLGYHNHNVEFIRFGDRTAWDILVAETDKSLVFFEVDVGWIAAAGLDPAAFLRRHAGRVRWLHVKDIQPSTKPNIALQMDPTEVGSGKQDWARILPAAHKAGCEHFYIEQEAPFTMPRLDAAAKGHAYLTRLRA
jgi:sugar phosphate isomerase/epimerase